MDLRVEFRRLCQTETRRWLLIVGVVGITHLMFQFILLPYGKALTSLLPHSNDPIYDKATFPILHSSTKSSMVRNPLTVDKDSVLDSGGGDAYNKSELRRTSEDSDNGFVPDDEGLDNDGDVDGFVSNEEDLDNPIELVVDQDVDESDDVMIRNGTATFESMESKESNASFKYASELGRDRDHPHDQNEGINVPQKELAHARLSLKSPVLQSQAGNLTRNISYLRLGNNSSFDSTISKDVAATSKNKSAKPGKKKMRCEMPPKSITSISEMNQILARHRRSSRAMRPRRSSPRDREILAAKVQIETAPLVLNDRDLYAPLFRNLSKFKRSYELMESTLKVYIYKDGKKPVFHLPIMKGLYASEGWFMKLMEGNKHYVVKDPRRAHLFYMPFSSRMLEYTIYVRNSHNRTNLRQYLKEYSEKLAAKYPFWNRTDGADHFLVACHDWAPYETRHHMEHCIKALCNADVTSGFKIGRDVSLPETYVRSARNPLRDLGGKAPSERPILAFYAGNMHGYLRPILLKYWKDKDPSMKIFGPMPPGVASKMNYIQHMKSSKFCICPRGYEVNSPRVVEAIFYECVPVIISDNFVPPFFEVFDWGAFSLILAEKDIPNLKEILSSVPEKRYLELQLGVRKVQRHFLWHPNPVKYDLFYMTLHSIWHNRVYQIKAR